MNDIEERVAAMEKRVAELKDWKQKYEEDKGKWDEEKEKLEKKLQGVKSFKGALIDFLDLDRASIPAGTGKETIDMEHKELVVNVTHSEREVKLTTGTVNGRILYCALTELSKDKEGFSEAELSEALEEHGWNVGHNTLAPNLAGLAKKGTLIRLEEKPYRYRLPTKVKVNVTLKQEAESG